MLKAAKQCPNCGSIKLEEYVAGNPVCGNCGAVTASFLLRGKKEFQCRPKKAELHDTPQNTKAYSNPLLSKMLEQKHFLNQLENFKEWQSMLRVSDQTEKNIATMLFEITRLTLGISLPLETLKTAVQILRELITKYNVKGRSMKVVAAAIVLLASRMSSHPAGLKEIARASGEKSRRIMNYCKLVQERLSLKYNPTRSTQRLVCLAGTLGLQERVVEVAEKLLNAAYERKITVGKNPTGIAAAAVYIAAVLLGKKISQREIANALGITEMTLRTRYKELVNACIIKVAI